MFVIIIFFCFAKLYHLFWGYFECSCHLNVHCKSGTGLCYTQHYLEHLGGNFTSIFFRIGTLMKAFNMEWHDGMVKVAHGG